MTRAACLACGQQVKWAITAAGKRQPLNFWPDPAGNTAAYQDALGVWRARALREGDEPDRGWTEHRYMPHAATCTARPKPYQLTRDKLPGNVLPFRRHRHLKADAR